jgi:ribosomal protein L16 Arg81 hydroxylase
MITDLEQVILEILKRNGINDGTLLEELRFLLALSEQEKKWLIRKLDKTESLFNLYGSLPKLLSANRGVERRENVSKELFLREFYCANRPVIILNLMREWRALRLWSPDYLKSHYGDELVEVMLGRKSDRFYEMNLQRYRKKILLKEYIDLVDSQRETNNCYMVANNHVLEKTELKNLLGDINFPEYLDGTKVIGKVFLWFGPAGTVTPLHHDRRNVLLAQVYGRKLIKLVPPYQIKYLYNSREFYSDVDCDNPDYDKYPLFRHAEVTEVVLEPGESIFIPVGWWHYVKALDTSISVTFQNFVFHNTYELADL